MLWWCFVHSSWEASSHGSSFVEWCPRTSSRGTTWVYCFISIATWIWGYSAVSQYLASLLIPFNLFWLYWMYLKCGLLCERGSSLPWRGLLLRLMNKTDLTDSHSPYFNPPLPPNSKQPNKQKTKKGKKEESKDKKWKQGKIFL